MREWAGAGNPSIAGQSMAAAAENAKERWWEANIYRVAGEISLLSRNSDMAKAQAYFHDALVVARKQQAVASISMQEHAMRKVLRGYAKCRSEVSKR